MQRLLLCYCLSCGGGFCLCPLRIGGGLLLCGGLLLLRLELILLGLGELALIAAELLVEI